MPRPLGSPLFDLNEMELSGGMTHRMAVLLAERNLLPPPAEGGGGKGKTRLWNIRGIKHMALIGAVHAAGTEMLLAARLIQVAAKQIEEKEAYGRIPARLDDYWRKIGTSPTLEEVPSADEGDNDWQYHLWLRGFPHAYTPRVGQKYDWRIVVAGRRYLYTGTGMKVAGSEEFDGYEPVARVDAWDRGQDATVSAVEYENIDGQLVLPLELKNEYISGRRDAVGIIIANASLAIRLAMDKIADFRLGRLAEAEQF